MPFPVACIAATGNNSRGQNAAPAPFVGAYDAIANLVHVYEPARCTLSAYTGNPLIRLRRASDNAESDFSHVSVIDPELDVAAIAAWAGGASYIVSVYDQKTGDTITQANAVNQPLFVASIQNGHAGGRFDGSNHLMQGAFTIGGALSQPFSVYSGAKLDAAAVNDGNTHYFNDGNAGSLNMFMGQFSTPDPDAWIIFADNVLQGGASDSNFNLWSALFNGASSEFWINTVSEASGNAGADNPTGLTIGARQTGALKWDGDWTQTVIADPSHSAAQRAAMETAANSYWSYY